MRHINITKPVNDLSTVMVTEKSNSFGDQILELKILVNNSNYETVRTSTQSEGDWYDSTIQIKNWAIESMQFIFLDWANNFLSVSRFAECYQISDDAAHSLINEGRTIHESIVKSKEKSK